MVSYVTPKKGVEYITYITLPSVASSNIFQVNPTIAAGDFKVSIDGGAEANLATLPAVTPAGGKRVKITLSTSEMNGDNISVIGSDAAGGEWKDVHFNIQTSARQIDDLAYPTTSGRSIDVTAGGEVGIDWANIGSPTTTVSLSGTTVKTATDVETDTADIQSRLPSALVSGRIDASVGAMAANVLTATAINDGAITAAKIADGAIDAATFAAGAIDAAAIATNAIDADAIAADAVTEIQSGLSTLTAAGIRTAVGLASANLDTQLDALPTAAENATAVLTTAMTESYAADGAAPTLAQAVFLTMQSLSEFAISSTTITVKKLDGSTTAATFTLDDATTPTSRTRAT